MSKEIEKALDDDDWVGARHLIEAALEGQPDDHWLLTRLGLTYYEQRHYEQALAYSSRALALAPECPLVLWDYAGALEMLDRPEEALQIYQRLVDRGVDSIAYGECGEGKAWARGLVADCHYRMSGCWKALGDPERADREFEIHLDLRGPGCRSIYPLKSLYRPGAPRMKPPRDDARRK